MTQWPLTPGTYQSLHSAGAWLSSTFEIPGDVTGDFCYRFDIASLTGFDGYPAGGTGGNRIIRLVQQDGAAIVDLFSGGSNVAPNMNEPGLDNAASFMGTITGATRDALVGHTWRFFFDNGDDRESWEMDITYGVVALASTGCAPITAPPPPPSVDFDVYTPDGVFVVALENLLEKRIRVELNADGSGFFRIHRSNAAATAANLAKGNIVRVTFTEIDPDPIWEFVIQEGDFQLLSSDEDGGEELSFGGPGTLSVLRNAIVHPVPQDHPTDPDPSDPWERQEGAVKWIDQEAGNIIRRLIQEAEVRGVYGTGTYDITKTFTNTQDTDGNAWVQMGAWLAPIGASLYDEVMRLVAAGQLEIEMAVGLVLNAYQSIGVDRTSTTFATGKVRFVKGVNIADDLQRAIPGGEFVSHAIVQGTDGQYVYDDLASYPYVRERYATVNSDDDTVLAEAAAALLGAHEDAQEPILFAHRVPWPGDGNDETAGIYLPGPAGSANGLYWVGDLVTLHTGSAEWDYNNATHRVYAITLYEDETGYLAPPIVELNAPFPSEDGEQGALSTATVVASGGGSSGGGTAGPHVHTLASLSNVDPDAPADGDVLTYDSGTTRWGPAAPTAEDTVHRADTDDAHDASAISFTPVGTIASTNVQAALEEVAAEASGTIDYGEDGDISTLDYDDTPSAGVLDEVARADHVHGMPSEGGGGGGGSGLALDSYALHGTYGFDFDGASLPVAFTRRNYVSGDETYQVGADGTGLRIAKAGQSAGDGYFMSATGLPDGTYAMKYVPRHIGPSPTTFAWGIAVIDSSGSGIATCIYDTPSAPLLITVTTYSTYGGSYVQVGASGSGPNVSMMPTRLWIERPVWIYIRKSGTSWYTAFSLDGHSWSSESSALTWSGTIDRIGFMDAPLGTVTSGVGQGSLVDVLWFNKIA